MSRKLRQPERRAFCPAHLEVWHICAAVSPLIPLVQENPGCSDDERSVLNEIPDPEREELPIHRESGVSQYHRGGDALMDGIAPRSALWEDRHRLISLINNGGKFLQSLHQRPIRNNRAFGKAVAIRGVPHRISDGGPVFQSSNVGTGGIGVTAWTRSPIFSRNKLWSMSRSSIPVFPTLINEMIHVPENVRRFLVDHRVVYQREQAGRDRGPAFGDRA